MIKMMPIVHFFQSLSFNQCAIFVPVGLAFLVFILPGIRKALKIEVDAEMSEGASEAFGAIALFFVFIAATSLTTLQGFQKDGLKVTETEVAHITNLDRELVRIGDEKAEAARVELKKYTSEIVTKEWKAMAEGHESPTVDDAFGKLTAAVHKMDDDVKFSEKTLESIHAHMEKVSDTRVERIQVSNLRLSFIYWDMLLAFIGIMLAISFFNVTKVSKRIAMAGKMIAISFTLVLILQTEGVFVGDIAVKPTHHAKALEKMKVRTADTN
jgi:hypothetical protein